MSNNDYQFYNVHGIKLKVEKKSASADSAYLHLSHFQTQQEEDVDITITDKQEIAQTHNIGSGSFFHDGEVFKSANFCIEKTKDCKFTVSSKISFAPNFLVQLQCLTKQWTMIHGAAIEYNGKGVLFPAWGNTGKTALVSQFIKDDACKFLGDDFAILSADAQLYSFPLPFSLYYYHEPLFPEVFKKKKRMLLSGPLLSAAGIAKDFLRPIVKASPILESKLRTISPEYMSVPAEDIVGKEKICSTTPLSKVVYLERYSGTEIVEKNITPKELRKIMFGILQYEFEQSPLWKETLAMSAFGIVDLYSYFESINNTIKSALEKVDICKVMLPQKMEIEEVVREIKGIIE